MASLSRTADALSCRASFIWALVKGEGFEIALALVQSLHISHLHSVAREPEMDNSQDYCRYTVLYLNGLLYM